VCLIVATIIMLSYACKSSLEFMVTRKPVLLPGQSDDWSQAPPRTARHYYKAVAVDLTYASFNCCLMG
jgi:hypothetical protein